MKHEGSRPGTRPRRGFGLAGLVSVGVLLLAGCSSAAGGPTDVKVDAGVGSVPASTSAGTAFRDAASGPLAGGNGAQDPAMEGPTAPSSGAVPDVGGPLIVRTGQLDLQVADVDAAIRDAERAVTAVGGYVAGSQRSGDGEKATASVNFRIPAARWTDALDALRAVGTKILGEQTSSQEVTAQVVDLGARLANLHVTETALQGIMDRAMKIPDVLAVQEQLTGVRQQIEELTAQQQTLENQAALASLSVTFSPPPAVAVTQVREGWDPAHEVDLAAATLVGIGQGLAGLGIWVLIVGLPVVLAAGLLALIGLLVARRLRRRGPPAPAMPPVAGA
jgi:hypothetical protein